jgi:hypothetical protein
MLFLNFKNNMDLNQYTLEDKAYPITNPNGTKKFNNYGFENFDLVYYSVPGDNSCFFHCILLSHFIPYRKNGVEYRLNDKGETIRYSFRFSRTDYCANFRIQVANSLYDKRRDQNGFIVKKYDLLAGGNIKDFAKNIPFYQLDNLHAAICNYKYCVGEEILEIISDVIEQNIFILNYEKEDIYNGIIKSYYREEWPSIVLLYYPTPEDDSYIGHYNLIGIPKTINNTNLIVTHFKNNHSFIQFLLKRENDINKKFTNNK